MRAFAILLAIVAAACLAGSVWLWAKTLHFFQSAEYAPHSAHIPNYTVGNVEADGTGILGPVVLMLALGLFLAKFSFNLWRSEKNCRKMDIRMEKAPHAESKQAPEK